MAVGTTYNPMQVAMGRSGGAGPYLWTGGGEGPPTGPDSPAKPKKPGSVSPISTPVSTGGPSTPATPTGTLGPQSIRATGSGPFDAAYRQNLATYAGGQFSQPSGGLSFNPTDISTFPGAPTGGGTAPVTGMPQSLLDQALAGQGFSWTPPQPAGQASPGDFQTLQDWMKQFMLGGSGGQMRSFL